MDKSTAEYWYEQSERHLAAANRQSEKGNNDYAEKLFLRSEKALIKANKLAGN